MMRLIITIILIVIGFHSNAQINLLNDPSTEIRGVIGQIENPKVQLTFSSKNGTDTLYILTFRNQKYQSIVDFRGVAFNSNKTKINDVYDLFMSVYKSENINNKNYRLIFELEGKKIAISNSDGNVWLYTTEGFVTITKDDINKIFNKN